MNRTKLPYGFALVFFLIFVGFFSSCAEKQVKGEWSPLPPMPTPRSFVSASVVGDDIYLIGGSKAVLHKPVIEVFSIPGNSFGSTQELPLPQTGHSAVVFDGQVYTVGGLDYRFFRNDLNRFDPDKDTWIVLTSQPNRVDYQAAVGWNDKLFVLGGLSTGKTVLDDVSVYSIADDTWTSAAKMPAPRLSHAAVTAGDRIYVFGGTDMAGGATLDTFWEYIPESDTWIEKGSIPLPRMNHEAIVLDGRIYLLGGTNHNQVLPLAQVDVYLPDEDRWITAPGMINPRTNFAAVSDGEKIYVWGGAKEPDPEDMDLFSAVSSDGEVFSLTD